MHARGLRLVVRLDGGGRLGVALIRHGSAVPGLGAGGGRGQGRLVCGGGDCGHGGGVCGGLCVRVCGGGGGPLVRAALRCAVSSMHAGGKPRGSCRRQTRPRPAACAHATSGMAPALTGPVLWPPRAVPGCALSAVPGWHPSLPRHPAPPPSPATQPCPRPQGCCWLRRRAWTAPPSSGAASSCSPTTAGGRPRASWPAAACPAGRARPATAAACLPHAAHCICGAGAKVGAAWSSYVGLKGIVHWQRLPSLCLLPGRAIPGQRPCAGAGTSPPPFLGACETAAAAQNQQGRMLRLLCLPAGAAPAGSSCRSPSRGRLCCLPAWAPPPRPQRNQPAPAAGIRQLGLLRPAGPLQQGPATRPQGEALCC